MKETIPLSVILPYCNSEKTLAGSIESVLSQSFSCFELLLADYGSTDNSEEIVNSFKDNRIRKVKCATDYVAALNSLMEQAVGKYIVRMDAVYTMSSGRLRRQYRYMEQHPEVGCLMGYSEEDKMDYISQRIKDIYVEQSKRAEAGKRKDQS